MSLIHPETLESAPNAGLRLTLRHLSIFLGAISCFFWLLPVVGAPGGGTNGADTSSITRYLRIIMPLCVFFLIPLRRYLDVRRSIALRFATGVIPRSILRLLGMVLALGILPLAAGLFTANSVFLVTAVMPLVISLFFLLGVTLLEDFIFKNWVIGLTGAALLFLLIGIGTSHFEPTTYYGRPRILMGFVHPIHTASVILAAAGFVILTGNDWVRRKSLLMRWFLLGLFGSTVLVLMLLAQSRNVLLSLCLGLCCAWIGSRFGTRVRFFLFVIILVLPVGIYLFVLTGSPLNPIWAVLNDLSSQRLALLQTVLASSIDLGDARLLFEPSSARLTALSDYVGFSATDSVFQTFFFNYGLISLIGFMSLLLALGWNLALRPKNIYPYGAMCGIVLFFSLDAQGITTSNLILFVVFSYAVRTAVAFQTP